MTTVQIGQYNIFKTKLLGKGSFSKVYMGEYMGDNPKYIKKGTQVAIKIMKLGNLSSKHKKALEDEAYIMKIIMDNPHPNIVECYDVIRDNDNKLYIIMEYCDSGDLRDILKKPIKEKYTQFYFYQLASGLKYLYGFNIVHRDIKPRNILLTNSRRILKIADFGFAKQSEVPSMYDTICGSPLYMAPEILSNISYNKQTDLWSIGMMLYEMLFGFHPFDKCKTVPELKYSLENDMIEIPPINNPNKDISNECLNFLESLLQKNVRNRMTWDDFFTHRWINIKKNEVIQENIIRIESKTQSEKKPDVPIQIIDNYFDDIRKSIVEDELLFEMDLGDNNNKNTKNSKNNTTMRVKSVIDKSSVLCGSATSSKWDIVETMQKEKHDMT